MTVRLCTLLYSCSWPSIIIISILAVESLSQHIISYSSLVSHFHCYRGWKTPPVLVDWVDKVKKWKAKMELRRNVKAPKRYDDESFDDPDRKPSPPPPRPPRPPPARTRIRSAVQPKIIEFNPDLPPAAFPTLNSWVPTKPEVDDLDSTVDPSLLSLDPNWSPTHTKPKIIHDFILPVYPRHSSQEMDGSDGFMEQGHLPMTHPPNSMLTSEEAFMLEMQTSDEEEPSDTLPQTRKQTVCEMHCVRSVTLTDKSAEISVTFTGERCNWKWKFGIQPDDCDE